MKKLISVIICIMMIISLVPVISASSDTEDRELLSALITTTTGKACIDFPDAVNGNKFSDTIMIQGWAVDSNAVSAVYVQIDSRAVMTAQLYNRPDVAEAFPGYPTGKEGFTLSLPGKDFPTGTHTVKISYTAGGGASYSLGSVDFTVTNEPAYADCYKLNGHTYYLFDNHYTRTEAEAYASKEGIALADVSGNKAKEAVRALAERGGSFFYMVGGGMVVNAKAGTITSATSDYIEEKCGFILEATDTTPAMVVKGNDAVYAVFDMPKTLTQAESLAKKMNGVLAPQAELNAFSQELSEMEQENFRMEAGYAAKDGTFHAESTDVAMGLVLKYTKPALSDVSVTHDGKTFYTISQVMPWSVAAKMAELMGGRLAVVPDKATQDKIASVVTGNTNFSYWLGGNDLEKEGVFAWIDGTPVSETLSFQSGEPNNYDYNEDYLMIYRSSGAINDNGTGDIVSMQAGFILEVSDEEAFVPADALWFQNHAYIRYEGEFTRLSAEHAASRLGGKLLSVDTDKERLALADFVKDSALQGYWIKNKDMAFSVYAANAYRVTEASSRIGLIVEFDAPVEKVGAATLNNTRYVAYTASMPYEAAAAYAIAMGGKIALPENAEENALIATIAAEGKYFIGAKKQNDGFVSENNEALGYTAWGTDTNGTYACIDNAGVWQAVLHAQPESIGFVAAYENQSGTVVMDTLYQKDGVNIVSVEIAQHETADATLLYCLYAGDGRLLGVTSEKITVEKNHVPLYKEKSFSGAVACVRVLLWDNTQKIVPMAKAQESAKVASYADRLPQGDTDFAAFAKEGMYYLRNKDTKTYLTLSNIGIKTDTKAVLSDAMHELLAKFRVARITEQTASITPLCSNNGTGNRLTVTENGADYASTESSYFLTQNTDGTFCLMNESKTLALSSALCFEAYSGAANQKWELVSAEALAEKSGALHKASTMYQGTDAAYAAIKSLASSAAVTIYGNMLVGDDGAEWCYVSDGTDYGFVKKEDVKISGASIYTYEQALAKKCAAGDGQGVLGYGVDVSKWDADVDYNILKKNGYSFVIIRVGTNYKGTYSKDAYFEQNYTNARAAGMEVGVYFYTYSTSVAGAQQDADQVAAWLNKRELTYPVYYDLEDSSISSACSYSTITEMARTFLSRMENTHNYYSGVYANLNWMNNMFDSKAIGANYDLWVAAYTYSVNRDYSSTYGIWQYSGDRDYIEGMPNTQADLNVVYKNYPEIIRALGMSYTN